MKQFHDMKLNKSSGLSSLSKKEAKVNSCSDCMMKNRKSLCTTGN